MSYYLLKWREGDRTFTADFDEWSEALDETIAVNDSPIKELVSLSLVVEGV